MRYINTENCVEKRLLAANPVVLERVMDIHRLLVDQGKPVGSARTPCNSTENDKPIIIIMYFFRHLGPKRRLFIKTVYQVAETRSSHDRRVDANMASREHYLQYGVRIVDWTIYFRSSLCYLMKGRRLGP